MRFTVVWNPAAKRTLARLWTDAKDRTAIANASDEIDRALEFSADTAGEGRSGTTRVIVAPPLIAYFDVSEHNRTAIIFAVWRLI